MTASAFELVIADARVIELFRAGKKAQAVKRACEVAGLKRRDAQDMLESDYFARAVA